MGLSGRRCGGNSYLDVREYVRGVQATIMEYVVGSPIYETFTVS